MAGTILGQCSNCGTKIDYDPLMGGRQYCGECQVLENEDFRLERGMEDYYNNKYLK